MAFGLFERQGFEGTTVGDIARAAGIGRRTFFRYFASKNDVPWGGFEERLERMRARLAGCPPQTPLAEAIRLGVITFHEASPGGQARARPAPAGPAPAGPAPAGKPGSGGGWS